MITHKTAKVLIFVKPVTATTHAVAPKIAVFAALRVWACSDATFVFVGIEIVEFAKIDHALKVRVYPDLQVSQAVPLVLMHFCQLASEQLSIKNLLSSLPHEIGKNLSLQEN